MSTACITEVHSFMSYKCETPNQLPNSLPCKTLDGPKMAPLEQQKTTESDALVAEHPDEQYASTGTNSNSNSSENNSDTQQDDEDSVNKLRDLPLSDSPPSVNGAPKGDRDVPFFVPPHLALNYPHNFFQGGKRKPKRVPMGFLYQGANMPVNGQEKLEFDELYHCQKCEFVGRNDDELHVHSRKHDPYECGECGLMSDAPENLKTHMKEEHPKIAASKRGDFIIFHEPESIEISPESSPKNKKTTKVKPFEENIDKPRKTTCKMCNNFTGNSKKEYYDHLEERHSEDGKLLRCHICPFIALYKHHLEYHLRNHFGSKPFVCEQCKYACVNRSMLNSHYKSHSNIYQYSCKNCQYMTKYLHSLKMHLRKYNHEPGQTLNPDGTVNKNAMIDTHGKRRGPKSKKRKRDDHTQEQGESPKSKSSPSPPSPYLVPIMPSQDIRILFNPQIHNNYTGNLCVRAGPSEPSNYVLHSPPSVGSSTFRCAYCEFVSNSLDVYQYHVLSHGAQDHLSYGSFSPKYPAFSQQPYNFGPPGFGSIFSPDSFSRNIANQPTTVESRNINEGRNMDVTNNDIHFQNPISYRKYYDALVNNGCIKKLESASRFPINSQQITQRYHRIREEAEQILKSIGYPSPNGIPTIKEEIPEYMNGIGSPSTKNPIDNGPLDLTIKQPTTPETKCLETGALRGFGSLIGGGMNRASSVSPKIGNEESKVTTQKTNRRKGRAFKLNQYAMESEPLSDGAEAGSEKMPVFYEFKTYSNQRGSKSAFGSAVRKSVPRINFKPTLNATKWNGHDSHEPKPSEFLPFPELAYTEPNCADLQTTGQKARDASDDCWCPHCDMYSASPRLQEYHSSYHSKNDPFTCAKCGLRCNDKDGFNYHIILGSRINGNCINSIEECKS